MSSGADIQELHKQFKIKNFEATCSITTARTENDKMCILKLPEWHAPKGQSFQLSMSWKHTKHSERCLQKPDGDAFLGLLFTVTKMPVAKQTFGRLSVELVNAEPSANLKRKFQAFALLIPGGQTGWSQELGEQHHLNVKLKDVLDTSKGWLQSGALCVEAKLELATEGNALEDAASGTQPISKVDLLKNWAGIYQSGEESDVIIKVRDKEIHAHSLVLKAQSKVFAATLSSPMRESGEKCIVIDGLEPLGVQAMIGYLYSGEVGEEFLRSHANALSVLEAAHRYDIPSLENLCIKQLSSGLDVNCVAEWLHVADLIGNTGFRHLCLNFIHRHIAEVQATDGYATYILPRPALLAEIISSMFPPAKRQRTEE